MAEWGTVHLTRSEYDALLAKIKRLEQAGEDLARDLEKEHNHNRTLAAENVRLRKQVNDAATPSR